jgi:hypothetical protein
MTNIQDQLRAMPEKIVAGETIPGLRILRHYYKGLREHPKDIRMDSPEGVVFYNLNLCYKNQNSVSEGIIGDIIWGFRQSGIPVSVVRDGLVALKNLGYMTWDINNMVMLGEPKENYYIRWGNKFLELLLTQGDSVEIPKELHQDHNTFNITDGKVEKV